MYAFYIYVRDLLLNKYLFLMVGITVMAYGETETYPRINICSIE